MSIATIEQQIRKSIDPKKLREWMRPKPYRVVRDLGSAWLLIIVSLVLLAQCFTWWAGMTAFLIIGFSQYALFILGHDGLHSCLNSNRKVNDFMCRWLIYGPMFMGFEDGKRSHLEHHKTLGTEADPDRYIHTFAPKNSLFNFILFLTGMLTFWKTVLKVTPLGVLLRRTPAALAQGAVGVPVGSDSSGDSYVSEVQRAGDSDIADSWKNQIPENASYSGTGQALSAFILKRVPVFVSQALILAFFLLVGLPWWSYFVFWLAPIYFCVFLCDEIRAFCDHAVPAVPDSVADDKRLISFLPSFVERLIFSPHNMNYHAEHHLWPGVPYYNRPMIRETLKDYSQVTYRESYVAFVLYVMRKLPLKEDSQ